MNKSNQNQDEINFHWYPVNWDITDQSTQAVMADSANGWIFSSAQGKLYRMHHNQLEIITEPAHIKYYFLLGFTPDNIWLSCFDSLNYRYFLRHFDGKDWHDIYTPNTDLIRGMDHIASDNIWGVCEWGEIIHFNGIDWQLVPSSTFAHLNCIKMVNDSLGWIGGEYRGKGLLLRWNGRKWQTLDDQFSGEFSEIFMVNEQIGWAFYLDSTFHILRLENNHWSYFDLSSVVKDTTFAQKEFNHNSIFIRKGGIVTKIGNFHYSNLDEQTDEILFHHRREDEFSYLFNDRQAIHYLKSKPHKFSFNFDNFSAQESGNGGEYGVAFGDIDNDGDDDIYIINASEGNRLKLYGGNSRIKSAKSHLFVDAADRLNILGVTRAEDAGFIYDMGVTLVDVDNDNDLDIYITSLYDNNMLYESRKGQRFREIAQQARIDGGKTRSNVGIWGDVDNDGDVDLFVTNEDTTNMLFLNNGFGKFQEITRQAGLISTRSGKGATFGDIDFDGDLDLIVPYFGSQNRIYRNDGIHPITRLPIFCDITKQCLPNNPDSLAKTASASLADFDNDGDLDLYFANLVATNRLYENDGTGYFTDMTSAAGLTDTSLSHHACFFDADNDGNLDIFITNRGRNLFFKNIGNKEFIIDNTLLRSRCNCYSTGFACGDPDNDGDLDCYLANNDHLSILYQNQTNNHNFLKIKLIGTKSNRDAIGAKTLLYEAGHLGEQKYLLGLREINGGYGYGCMNSTVIHYGVRPGKKYDLKIWFPSGIELVRNNLEPGQTLTVEEQAGLEKWISVSKRFIIRFFKSASYQLELAKFAGLMIVLIGGIIMIQHKNLVEPRFQILLLVLPLLIYLILDLPLMGNGFWMSHFLPFAVSFFIFGLILFLSKYQSSKLIRERLAEELLNACRVFDHGKWATSCLNQLQLFSTNLPFNQPISEKLKSELGETITGFYELVFKEVFNISQLAKDSSIKVNQAVELERQLLFLSENLEKIKVAMVLNQGVSSDIWQNVNRLIDQIKMNIREISFGVNRLYSCNILEVVNKTTRIFQLFDTIPILFPQSNLIDDNFFVSIKASELTKILENLFQNAKQATRNQTDPQIRLSFRQTDQYFFLEVQDNGKGIPKKFWNKIFEQNYTTKSDSKGGFGLYYSKKTLEKYGGSIDILKTGKNKGTMFSIKLRRL